MDLSVFQLEICIHEALLKVFWWGRGSDNGGYLLKIKIVRQQTSIHTLHKRDSRWWKSVAIPKTFANRWVLDSLAFTQNNLFFSVQLRPNLRSPVSLSLTVSLFLGGGHSWDVGLPVASCRADHCLSHFLTSHFTTSTQSIGPYAASVAAAAAAASVAALPRGLLFSLPHVDYNLQFGREQLRVLISHNASFPIGLIGKWVKQWLKRSESPRRVREVSCLNESEFSSTLIAPTRRSVGIMHRSARFTIRKPPSAFDFGLLWQRGTTSPKRGGFFCRESASSRSCSPSSGFLQDSRVAESSCSRQGRSCLLVGDLFWIQASTVWVSFPHGEGALVRFFARF